MKNSLRKFVRFRNWFKICLTSTTGEMWLFDKKLHYSFSKCESFSNNELNDKLFELFGLTLF